jgi:hypothetical protein
METLVRSIGALACLIGVLGALALARGLAESRRLPPHGLSMPALAIEFARSTPDVEELLGKPDAGGGMREQIRKGLYGDYVFIAMYWLLLALMSALLAARGGRWAVWVAVVAAVCATGAAIFDVVENLSIAALLDAAEIKAHMVSNVASAGFGKWLLISISMFAVSFLFLRDDWLALLGVLNLLVAVSLVYGLLRSPRVIEWAFLLNFVGVLAVGVVFSVWPRSVLRRL